MAAFLAETWRLRSLIRASRLSSASALRPWPPQDLGERIRWQLRLILLGWVTLVELWVGPVAILVPSAAGTPLLGLWQLPSQAVADREMASWMA